MKNRSHVQTNAVLKRQFRTRLTLIGRQIVDLDAEIARHIADDKPTARKREILCSVPGLGPNAAALILTVLSEIGALDRKQAGSIARLVPHSRESGHGRGSPSSVADARLYAMRSPFPRRSPCVSTRALRPSPRSYATLESRQRSRSWQSCASCWRLPPHWSKPTASGRSKHLADDGYSIHGTASEARDD